jgi:hypothetical protein
MPQSSNNPDPERPRGVSDTRANRDQRGSTENTGSAGQFRLGSGDPTCIRTVEVSGAALVLMVRTVTNPALRQA